MVEASVGFHCRECVAEGNRTVRQARTVFGGKVIGKPYVTWTLLGLIAVGFVLQQVMPQIAADFGMHGFVVHVYGEWYRIITSAFLHGGILHLLFNGYALFLLGSALERWLGHGRFLTLWVLGALSGSALSLLAAPGQLSIGASGAIFALFGAVFVTGRRLGLDTRMILVLLVVNLGITFLVPNISWTAHIGGLVAGFAIGAVFALLPRGEADHRRRSLVHTLMAAAYAVLLAALLIGGPVLVWPALGLA
ncbi:rhomboid family intramembrane serine protease [Nocardiopsis kunsanensis]|nr:rhomboid family intramembrane serine protease [Nocardiopsis kunsanensis]